MTKLKPFTDATLAAADDPSDFVISVRKHRIARKAAHDVVADRLRDEVAALQSKLTALMLTGTAQRRDLVAALLGCAPSSSALVLLLAGRPAILSHGVAGVGPHGPAPKALLPVNR